MKNSKNNIKIRRTLLPFKYFHNPESSFMRLSPRQSELVVEFNRKAEQGLIEFESVNCLCGSLEFDLIASVDRHSMRQKTIMCVRCGLIQSNPRMTDKEYAKFYSSDMYRLCYEGEDYLITYEDRYEPRHSRHIFDEISGIRTVDPTVSVLEVGAGGGWNLVLFANAGAAVVGIDYSESLVNMGNRHGLNMKQGSIDDIKGLYDIIIINHALEHFPDPVESLKKIIRHLDKSGLLYIGVPNIMNFGIGQLQNAHVYYFTPLTFEYYCAKAGLKSIKIGAAQEVHMFGTFTHSDVSSCPRIDGHYGTMINRFKIEKLKCMTKIILSYLGLYKR